MKNNVDRFVYFLLCEGLVRFPHVFNPNSPIPDSQPPSPPQSSAHKPIYTPKLFHARLPVPSNDPYVHLFHPSGYDNGNVNVKGKGKGKEKRPASQSIPRPKQKRTRTTGESSTRSSRLRDSSVDSTPSSAVDSSPRSKIDKLWEGGPVKRAFGYYQPEKLYYPLVPPPPSPYTSPTKERRLKRQDGE